MRSVCYGTWRECLRETNSILCQSVESWRLNVIVSVTMNVVSTKRINSDQKYIRCRCWGRGVLSKQAKRCQAACDDKNGLHFTSLETPNCPRRNPALVRFRPRSMLKCFSLGTF